MKYLYYVLHKGLVSGHFGLFHDWDWGPDPRDKNELGTFAHLVTGLKHIIESHLWERELHNNNNLQQPDILIAGEI